MLTIGQDYTSTKSEFQGVIIAIDKETSPQGYLRIHVSDGYNDKWTMAEIK
jgi:hypothetical protein